MSAHLQDLAKKGIKILHDTKAPRSQVPKAKSVPHKEEFQEMDIHKAAVKRFIKDKPSKKHVLEFFERIIEAEEKKL